MTKLTTISLTLAIFAATAHAGDPKPPAARKAPDAMTKEPAGKPAMEAPKPPQEVSDLAKGITGSWKCTGQGAMGPQMIPVTGKLTHKLDLDKFWIQTTFSGSGGGMTYKFTAYTGYDAVAKKWHRMRADSMGATDVLEAAGMTDGKIVWDGSHTMMGHTAKLRDTEELAKDGKSYHSLGEKSDDGGKTWSTGHDVTCKK